MLRGLGGEWVVRVRERGGYVQVLLGLESWGGLWSRNGVEWLTWKSGCEGKPWFSFVREVRKVQMR